MYCPFVIIEIIAKVPAIGRGIALSNTCLRILHAIFNLLILLILIIFVPLIFQQVADFLLKIMMLL